MDISAFINSRDIKKYHRDIGYEYNALEAAWLVYQCNNKTLKQKHEAWQWIIDNMPDMEVKNYGRCSSRFKGDSIHELLKDYMEMENAFIMAFKDSSGGYFYKYRRYSPSVKIGGAISDFEGFFSSWDKCISHILETEDAEDAVLYRISRRLPDETDDWIIHGSIEIDIAGQILDVSTAYEKEENKRWFYLDTFFDELWFSFPVPFIRGDIVSLKSRYHPEDHKPIVIDGIIVPCGWDEEEYIKKRKDYGDTSDMNIWGYAADTEWVSGFRGAYREVWDNYMDAEYYRDELKGYNRVLKPISSWLKGEFNDELDLLLAGYHHIMTDEYLKSTVPVLYTKEGLKLAGFPAEGDE